MNGGSSSGSSGSSSGGGGGSGDGGGGGGGGGSGGGGSVPAALATVRRLAGAEELQCLLAWLWQDETDEFESPNKWYSRAGVSLVIAFDEGRLCE